MTTVPLPRVELRQLREGAGQLVRDARERPSFALYLIALALLPIKWLSPFADAQAGWTDVFIAAAAVAWAVGKVRARARPRLRPCHYGLALYVLAGVLSAAFASSDPSVGRENVLIMAELVTLFVLTSDFRRRRLMSPGDRADGARGNAFMRPRALTVLALGLFYARVPTDLVGSYGGLEPSDLYARVAAGFNSAPLLGSFFSFASAVVADPKSELPGRVRALAQVILLVLVVLTVSRALLGFLVAAAIRFGAARGTRTARRLAVGAVVASLVILTTLTLGGLTIDPSKPWAASYSLLDTNRRARAWKPSRPPPRRSPTIPCWAPVRAR